MTYIYTSPMKTVVNGIEIAFDDEGSGTPVVLLHGYPFNRTMWREQVAALKPKHRVITPDLRGHGESTVTPGVATMEDMANDVAALLESLDVSVPAIGGLSMGGYVSLAFARLFPSQVRALLLADTRAQADTEEAKQNREQQAEKALSEGMEAIADGLLPKLLAPATPNERPDIVKRVREMIVSTNPAGAAAALRGMARRPNHISFLPQIIAPTLILVGSEDTLTPVADSELMHREIGASSLKIIEGAGHVSNFENTDDFNHALGEFLNAL